MLPGAHVALPDALSLSMSPNMLRLHHGQGGRPAYNNHVQSCWNLSVGSAHYQNRTLHNVCGHFCNNAYRHMMIQSLISRNHHAIHPSVSQSRCTASQDGIGVWTGPVCAARAKRSLAPACAVPLASSLHCVGRSHRTLLAHFQTPTTYYDYILNY